MNRPVSWPARSPNLTMMDIFGGILNQKVMKACSKTATTRDNMKYRIRRACLLVTRTRQISTGHGNFNMLRNVRKNFIVRVLKCNNGGHFENLKKLTEFMVKFFIVQLLK